MANRIAPFIKRLRVNGGTIYSFSSSIEDIGLNINERNNVVKISHFALLDIPNVAEPSLGYHMNTFNVRNIAGAWEYEQASTSIKDGRVIIAESFQNYALNLEANLLNQSNYNPQLSSTVSERVLWKWLKETGAIRWNDPSLASNGNIYWQEEINSNNYESIVKYVGQVSAGNVRIDNFGTYNETYVLIPTSHGQTNAYFKQLEDDNYKHGMQIGDGGENILGRDSYTKPHPDGLSFNAYYDFVDSSTQVGSFNTYYDNSTGSFKAGWWYNAELITPLYNSNIYLTDSSNYLTDNIYNVDLKYQGSRTISFRRSKLDCMTLELDLNNLKTIYGDNTLTYDKMAVDYMVNDSFNFNAILIYYTIYNSTKDQVLATNLLGIMFLDAPYGNTAEIGTGLSGIEIPSLEKIASGDVGFGTSYSLRLNIKTDNLLDDTQATIIDESTSNQLWGEEWQTAFRNLGVAVNTLTQQNSTLSFISGQYITLQGNQTEMLNRLLSLENIVNDIGRDIKGAAGTIALFSDGDDPLVESSIYMKNGKIGLFNNDPKWGVDIDSSIKTKDIILEKTIRDVSNNIIIGYGSPLQIGASTNQREINLYVGNNNPALLIDVSNNIIHNADVSIKGNFIVDGSVKFKSIVYFDSSIICNSFDFNKTYLSLPQNIGVGLNWDGQYLNVIPSSDVSAPGLSGEVQFTSSVGSLMTDSSFYWDTINKRLGLGTKTPLDRLHTKGNIRVDGSIILNGVELIGTQAAGSNTYVQYNSSGSFGASSSFTYDSTYGLYVLKGIKTNSVGLLNTMDSSITILPGNTPRKLLISSNDQLASAGSGGSLTLRSGNSGSSGGGVGGDVSIYAGFGSSGGTGGNIYINGGFGNGYGGTTTIAGGDGVMYGGNLILRAGDASYSGNVSIKSGYNGDISIGFYGIGNLNLNGLKLFIPTIPQGSLVASASEFLYVDSNNQIKKTSINVSFQKPVNWVNNNYGSNTNIITSNGDGSIYANSSLQFNNSTYTLQSANAFNIYAGNVLSAANGYDLNIKAGDVSTSGNGGNLSIISGNGSSSGQSGNIYLYPSQTGSTKGNVWLSNNGTTDIGRVIFPSGTLSAPSISFRAQLNTGFLYDSINNAVELSMSNNRMFRFNSSGNFYAIGDVVSYSTSLSDIKLKKNIYQIQDGLSKVIALNGVEYDRIINDEHHVGFIAQDVEKIIPEVVVETENLEDDSKYKAIRYNELIPYLVEAIKEQQLQINDLKKEIEFLRNK